MNYASTESEIVFRIIRDLSPEVWIYFLSNIDGQNMLNYGYTLFLVEFYGL
jgi:hypothetical protein